MSDEAARPDRAETLAAIWRTSRQEAQEVNARIAMLEQAVVRAIAGAPMPGDDHEWERALHAADLWLERAVSNRRDIEALLEGRAS